MGAGTRAPACTPPWPWPCGREGFGLI
uniref:Uncharacterized protein n=1 Tax=Arundo donax TaxID=35708 RepID=A0A0A9F7J0_ARUDO